jgi:hypothetical protein
MDFCSSKVKVFAKIHFFDTKVNFAKKKLQLFYNLLIVKEKNFSTFFCLNFDFRMIDVIIMIIKLSEPLIFA